MIKKLDLLIIKSYIGPFLATFFVSIFLLLMQFLWKYIDDMVGKGLELSVIGELLWYASAALVPMSLPLATLLASIMTFGNLGEYNELMAIKAAGVPLPRIMRPLIFLNIVIAIAAFFFSNNILPYTNLKMGALLYDVRQQRPELNIRKGVFFAGIDGIIMKVKDKDPKTNVLKGVMIYDHRGQNGNLNVTIADSGTMVMSKNRQYLFFTLYSGEHYEEVREQERYHRENHNFPHQRESFGKQQVVFELSGYEFSRTSTELFKNNYQMLNLKQLEFAQDSLKKEYNNRLKYSMKRNIDGFFFKHIVRTTFNKDTAINSDKMFKEFDVRQKIEAIDFALDEMRSSKISFNNMIDDLDSRKSWISRHETEWHKKFTLSVACLILFFIGAPLGAIVRKGGLGMPVVISVIFFLLYYIVSMMGEKYVKSGEVTALVGMWFASAVLLPLGIYFTYKASRDSQIVNLDFIFKIYSYFEKKLSSK
jgi:lipopolysaccharide export system permease protein